MSTATQEYNNFKVDIEEQIKELKDRLERHAERQAQDDKNWGYAGDLGVVNSNLNDILNFFAVRY